jgi:hypothetical protein
MMRVCEVCGHEEKVELEGNDKTGPRMLHLCENCRTDRKFPSFENDELL